MGCFHQSGEISTKKKGYKSEGGQYKSCYYCSPGEYFGDKANFKLDTLPYTAIFQIVESQGHRMLCRHHKCPNSTGVARRIV